jgi:uncharacterized protein (TIGR00369 family)
MRKQPSSRMCFICGRDNPRGLKLDFYEEAGQVRADFSLSPDYQGYPGVVHGGIVSAILDEASGRAVMIEGGDEMLMVTAKLSVRFRRPTPTETPLTAVGWVEHLGSAGAHVAGEIRLADGTVTASCQATLANLPQNQRTGWEAEAPYWKVYD